MGVGERLRLGRVHVLFCCGGWAPRCAAVAASERLRVVPGRLPGGGTLWQRNARVDRGAARLTNRTKFSIIKVNRVSVLVSGFGVLLVS